jgi:hypothetical protein
MRWILAGGCAAITIPLACGADGTGRAAVEGPDTKALGVFRDSESPSAAFTVRIAGGGPLKITGVMKTCGCAGAAADKSLLGPGDTATVRVTVEPYTLEGSGEADGSHKRELPLPDPDPRACAREPPRADA